VGVVQRVCRGKCATWQRRARDTRRTSGTVSRSGDWSERCRRRGAPADAAADDRHAHTATLLLSLDQTARDGSVVGARESKSLHPAADLGAILADLARDGGEVPIVSGNRVDQQVTEPFVVLGDLARLAG